MNDPTALLQFWRPILQVLDPNRRLLPQEADSLYSLRPRAPATDIEWQLRAELGTDQHSRFLLCGARGSGKTTELVRLGRRLQDEHTVLHVDLATSLTEGAGTLPIIVLIGAAALRRLAEWEGSLEAVAQRPHALGLWTALERYSDVATQALTLLDTVRSVGSVMSLVPEPVSQAVGAGATIAGGVASGARAAVELSRSTRALRELGRGPLGKRVPKDKLGDAQAVVEAVNQILVDLHVRSERYPLLLADGLDKMVKIEDVVTALYDEDLLRELAVPIVLSGPVSLRHDPRFNGMKGNFQPALLYNMPVVQPDGTPDTAGIASMMEVFTLRARQAGLPNDLVTDAGLAEAARMSSGIVREFLQILSAAARKAMQRGERRVGDPDVQDAITDVRHGLQNQLNDERIELLARVARKRTLPARKEADQMLFENFIACYPNGDVWFRPHETLVSYVEGLVPIDSVDAG